MNRFQRDLIKELRELGATDVHIDHGGKHPRLVWSVGSETFMQIIPSSPGDSARGIRNVLADVRRSMRETA